MKRIKDLLLSLFIFGSIVVVLLIVISFFNTKRTIEVTRNESNEIRLNNLKQRVNLLSDGECKTFLNKYITIVDKGNYDGEVKLRTLYDYFVYYPILSNYEDAQEKCNITQNEIDEYGIAGKYITLMTLPETLFDKYMFSYELNIRSEIRSMVEANMDNVLYQSMRFHQVEILNDYVTLAELKEENND